jgi:hypothetical protein
MVVDYWVFDVINGLAGRFPWLDMLGRLLAVYGLLVLMLLALAALWWPRVSSAHRRRYLVSLLISGALCAVLALGEWALTTCLLHHDLRSRPYNARWVTVLVTDGSHFSFPAWPLVLAMALGLPTYARFRRLGTAMVWGTVAIGFALVFVGSNYPVDVITGIMLGGVTGLTASALAARAELTAPRKRFVGLLWVGLLLWAGIMAVAIKPSQSENIAPAAATGSGVSVTPPPAVTRALQPIAGSATLTLQAATNRHLTAASLRIVLPTSAVSLPTVEALARNLMNGMYAHWPALGLATVDVSAQFPQGVGEHVGTLYTATVARAQWPSGGFSPDMKLPGKKFYHTQFLTH